MTTNTLFLGNDRDGDEIKECIKSPGVWFFSKTQLETWADCKRKYAKIYVDGKRPPQGKSAMLGSRVHKILEDYLGGTPIPYSATDPEVREASAIAGSSLHLLPAPHPGLLLEADYRFQSARTELCYTAIKDLIVPPGVPGPGGVVSDVPLVIDHKTTSDFRWAKSEAELRTDIQSVLYAYHTMMQFRTPVVDLQWNYMRTRGARVAQKVRLRVLSADVVPEFVKAEVTAGEIARIRNAQTPSDNYPMVADEAVCDKYGGCPFRHECNRGPADRVFFRKEPLPMSSGLDDFAASLAALQSAGGVAPAPAATPAATPGVTFSPAFLAQPAAPVAAAPIASPFADDAAALGIPVAATGAVGFNPPEKAGPIDPSPEEKIVAEAIAAAAAPPTEKKRGRPKAAKEAPPAPPAPVPAPEQQRIEAPAAPVVVPKPAAPVEGPGFSEPANPNRTIAVLFVDCVPNAPFAHFDDLLANIRPTLVSRCGGAADYRLVPYAQGKAQLAMCVREYLAEKGPCGALFVSSRSPEGSDAMSALVENASMVVRAVT